ncbi:hypothetical protein ACIRRA_10550 [Nocardia sp. NPDC101769]|uniref:hypothetical protein n=1 Tax=Nocardia sp. NPDC101769 TaxID=3364333 RepID=UPI0038174D62
MFVPVSFSIDRISGTWTIQSIRTTSCRYLNRAQVAERIGVAASALSRYNLPDPDAIIGPINPDGTLPKGTVRGWYESTIDEWHAWRGGRPAGTAAHG